MKKLFFILLCTLFSAASISAQDADNKSKKILSNLANKIKSYNTLRVDFTYKMENKQEKINESINGILYLKKEKYRLELDQQIVICDGKTVWTYLKDANEVQINNVTESEDEITPQNIFTIYEKGHRSKHIREGQENGKKVNVVELVPKETKQYYKVRLNIEKTTNMLVSAVVFDRNNTTFTYTISKNQPNISIADEKFTFNAASYPKVEIIDLR